MRCDMLHNFLSMPFVLAGQDEKTTGYLEI
jgi:hypothetical protein